jgi:hypothetical protein
VTTTTAKDFVLLKDGFIILKDVRISFPHLFRRPVINGTEGKCGAALMLDDKRHAGAIAALKGQIDELVKTRFKGRPLPAEKLCLRAGKDKGRPEYDGDMHVLSANNRDKPIVLGSNGTSIITEERDSSIYAGCYVNAKVRLWAQDNQYGKRINCELVAVQFARDGEPLDGSYVSPEDAVAGFDATSDDFLAA